MQQYLYSLLPVGVNEDAEELKKLIFKPFSKDGKEFEQYVKKNLIDYGSDGINIMLKMIKLYCKI